MTSAPKRAMSKREAPAAMSSMAQQARPMGMGQREFLRTQFSRGTIKAKCGPITHPLSTINFPPSFRRGEDGFVQVEGIGHALAVGFEGFRRGIHPQIAVATVCVLPALVPIDAGFDVRVF